MWKKKDWICLSVSAVAGFGLTMVGFYPSSATANDPVPVPKVVAVPTLTLDGVSITASSVKDSSVVEISNSTVFIKPGTLPDVELQMSNTTGSEKIVNFSTDIFTSNIRNLGSRVPMPTAKPISQWDKQFSYDLKPGEVKTVQLKTDVKLKSWSSATFTLIGGEQKIDALTLSTMPAPVALSKVPATQPAFGEAILGSKASQ